MRRALCLLVVASSLILGACGEPKPLTIEEYKERLCESADATPEEFPSTWGELFTFADSVRSMLESMKPPEEVREWHNAFLTQALILADTSRDKPEFQVIDLISMATLQRALDPVQKDMEIEKGKLSPQTLQIIDRDCN